MRSRLLLGTCAAALGAAAFAAAAQQPSWGAIASAYPAWGYAYEHPTREAAEREARAQCERAGRRRGASCEVRVTFERTCGAMAQGNYGEWGVATAPTAAEAARAAARQCDNHLPTEPCRVVVRACSPGG
ncbi:DUF4189 domain-containing protein [Xenophilus sp.]|uniref:DUF4189 domain-containing protein n=1 Tax=Xenophilus sp. TaxID=1873499 RepID=UPI0037DCD6BC